MDSVSVSVTWQQMSFPNSNILSLWDKNRQQCQQNTSPVCVNLSLRRRDTEIPEVLISGLFSVHINWVFVSTFWQNTVTNTWSSGDGITYCTQELNLFLSICYLCHPPGALRPKPEGKHEKVFFLPQSFPTPDVQDCVKHSRIVLVRICEGQRQSCWLCHAVVWGGGLDRTLQHHKEVEQVHRDEPKFGSSGCMYCRAGKV